MLSCLALCELCLAVVCYVILCVILSCPVLCGLVLSRLLLSCYVKYCLVLSCLVLCCVVLSCGVVLSLLCCLCLLFSFLSYLVMADVVLSCLVLIKVLLGRNMECDINVKNQMASSRHCKIGLSCLCFASVSVLFLSCFFLVLCLSCHRLASSSFGVFCIVLSGHDGCGKAHLEDTRYRTLSSSSLSLSWTLYRALPCLCLVLSLSTFVVS